MNSDPAPRESFPLTPLQQGMLYHHLAAPQHGIDIVQLVFTLPEEVDQKALVCAWKTVASRHGALRTAFRWTEPAQPEQVVHPSVELPLRICHWTVVNRTDREKTLDTFLAADRRDGIEMDRAPLWRLTLIKWADRDFSLVWTLHHAVLDGRSFTTVAREAFAIYDSRGQDRVPLLPEIKPYGDYLKWRAETDFTPSEGYWSAVLQGWASPTPLPQDPGISAVQSSGRAKKKDLSVQLPTELTERLLAFARANAITPNTLMQGAWALLLSRHSGEQDVVFGGTRACRKSSVPGSESMVGLFINTLPLRAIVHGDAPLIPWLQKLREQWVGMRAHEHSTLNRSRVCSGVPRDVPLFHSIVVYENSTVANALRSAGGAWSTREVRLLEKTSFALTLAVHAGEQMHVTIGYHTDRYRDEFAERLMGHLLTLLSSMCEPAHKRLKDVQMLTSAERRQIVVEWNDTNKAYSDKRCIHELIEQQVDRTPQNIALTYEGSDCSYADLNAKANSLTQMLRDRGVGRGDFVPLLFAAGFDLVIAELAVMKAGAAFAPLDPSWPAARVQSALNDLSPRVVLADNATQVDLGVWTSSVVKVRHGELVGTQQNPKSGAAPFDPVYLLFTSGSTGKPKGAVNHHAGIANRFFNMNDRFGCGPPDVIMASTAHMFDSSVWQYFWPLTNGARVVIPSSQTRFDPGYLLRLMIEQKVTLTDFVPALLAMVTDQISAEAISPGQLSALRQVLVGGESINPAVAYRFKSLLPGCGVTNAYGPTETSIGVIFYELPNEPVDVLPIGKPLHNVKALILDRDMNPVPVGVPGDLYIGGICVGLGYWNNDEATRNAFIANPYPEVDSEILYRTGDRARFLSDGNIYFLGRDDAQVKIRGYRIELGEVEAVLRECSGVEDCAVLACGDSAGTKRLVAFLVSSEAQLISVKPQLRDLLQEKLPAYMIPTAYVTLDRLPLSAGGKINRDALLKLVPDELVEEGGFVAPRTPIEIAVAAIWSEVLQVKQVGMDDDFFNLGGDSLRAVRIINRINSTLQHKASVATFFDGPTVRTLTQAIERKETAAG